MLGVHGYGSDLHSDRHTTPLPPRAILCGTRSYSPCTKHLLRAVLFRGPVTLCSLAAEYPYAFGRQHVVNPERAPHSDGGTFNEVVLGTGRGIGIARQED